MKPFALACILIVAVSMVGVGQTNVSGTINKDTTWTMAASPYIVTGSVYIGGAFTLKVDSGVVVRFRPSTGLYVYGNLRARHAVFTSSADTNGGNPVKGNWQGIQSGTSSSTPVMALDTCTVKFGGSSIAGMVYKYSGTGTITGCSIIQSSDEGVYVGNAVLTIDGTTISSTTNSGLVIQPSATVTFRNSSISTANWPVWIDGTCSFVMDGTVTFSGNTRNGIYMEFSSMNTMTLDTASIPYVFPNDMTVNTNNVLTVASGNVLKLYDYATLTINGGLVADGGSGQEIFFTTIRNDNLPTPGSDTNNDGTSTSPGPQNWDRILFNNSSIDSVSVLRRCRFTYGGYYQQGAVTLVDANPVIDSCQFASNYVGVRLEGTSSPVFTNNTIGSSQLVPIAMSFAASPVFSNNSFSFSDNQYDAIGLLGGTLPANAVVPIRSVTSFPNVTYLLLETVTVPSGKTLTIHKGVVIKGYYSDHRIVVQGKLVANGTADSMITFTSVKDDVFGNPNDTNNDGTASVPARENWGGIVFESGSDSASIMNYCRVKYGSLPYYAYHINNRYHPGGQITLINASPTISNCEIKDVTYGIYALSTSKPKIIDNQFINTTYTPIALSVSSDPFFSGNTFTNASWRGIGIVGEDVGSSGVVRQRTVAGITNITYVLLGDLVINTGTNVSIDPGVVIKSLSYGIYVDGGFRAKGTLANGPVVFTSLKDDNFGNPGDTNGDGNATAPARGNWETIRFRGGSDDAYSRLDSVIIKFGGGYSNGSVSYIDAGSSLSNATISDGGEFGIRCEGASTPVISNVVIANCEQDPVAMSLKANPTFALMTFTANGSSGIRILEGTLSSNATLARRDVAGITNIAYVVDNLTISPNAVLTIEPGVVIKLTNYYNAIRVEGALVAKGNATRKIVFTSISDDSNGGDTNNDGNGSAPARGNWSVIDFVASGADSLNELRNCIFRYGGNSYYYYYLDENGMVRIFNATVIVDSCTIEQSAGSGLGIFGSADPVVSNTSFSNITYTPVNLSMFSSPVFGSGNSALNIGIMAIGVKPETYSVDKTVPVRSFAGIDSMTYYLYGTMIVNTGTTITIPAGLVFKEGSWQVNGALAVLGKAQHPVVFTEARDDKYGRPSDTHGDGSLTVPTMDSGNLFTFADVSNDSASRIEHAIIRWRSGGIYLNQASPRIRNTLFERNDWGVVLTGVSNPVIDSCAFRNLTYAPMRLSLVSYPSSSVGNTILGTTFRGIGVLDNETLVQDVTLQKRNFGGITNIPYIFSTYTVASNAVLTVAPGVIMKFLPGTALTVKKGLIAEGGSTPDSVIVMTDIRDDSRGGDTNADSSYSTPTNDPSNYYYYYSGWSGVNVEDESLDPLVRFRNVHIAWAGQYYYSSDAAITTNNASPTISYSRFSNCGNALIAKGSSNPIINYCDFTAITDYGVNNEGGAATIDARWNWWGDNSGPTHASNASGKGAKASNMVNFTPWLGFGASNPVIGDVSLNGLVQAFDASLILKYVVNPTGPDSLNSLQRSVADVNAIGGISAFDASLILQYVVGVIPKLPAAGARPDDPDGTAKMTSGEVVAGRLTLGSGETSWGTTIQIPVRLENAVGVSGILATFSFDPNLLKFKAIASASGLSFAHAVLSGGSEVRIAAASVNPFSGDLATLTFEIPDNVRGTKMAQVSVRDVKLNEQPGSAAAGGEVKIIGKPETFELSQNFPNPFNPTTTIRYLVPDENSEVRIVIYNMVGQAVRSLVSEPKAAGVYTVEWNGTDDSGNHLSSGFYVCRMSSGTFTQTRKLMLVK